MCRAACEWRQWKCESRGALNLPFSLLPHFPYRREGKMWKALQAVERCLIQVYGGEIIPLYIIKRNWTWRPEFCLVPRSVQFLLEKKELLKKRNRYFYVPFLWIVPECLSTITRKYYVITSLHNKHYVNNSRRKFWGLDRRFPGKIFDIICVSRFSFLL